MKNETKAWARENLSENPPAGISLKVGDVVTWRNDDGVVFTNAVIGFEPDKYGRFLHLDTDAYGFPHREDCLQTVNGHSYNRSNARTGQQICQQAAYLDDTGVMYQ